MTDMSHQSKYGVFRSNVLLKTYTPVYMDYRLK